MFYNWLIRLAFPIRIQPLSGMFWLVLFFLFQMDFLCLEFQLNTDLINIIRTYNERIYFEYKKRRKKPRCEWDRNRMKVKEKRPNQIRTNRFFFLLNYVTHWRILVLSNSFSCGSHLIWMYLCFFFLYYFLFCRYWFSSIFLFFIFQVDLATCFKWKWA